MANVIGVTNPSSRMSAYLDPSDPDAPRKARERLQNIEAYWNENPGAAPGGSGETGLLPNDSQGWSALLNMQTEHQNLSNQLKGQAPVQVVEKPAMATTRRPSLTALGYDDINAINREPIDPTFEQRRQAGILADMDQRASASLREDLAENKDLFGLNTGRREALTRGVGDIGRREAERNAATAADIYFTPGQAGIRQTEDERQRALAGVRYVDPALARAGGLVGAASERAGAEQFRAATGAEAARDVAATRAKGQMGTAAITQGGVATDVDKFMPTPVDTAGSIVREMQRRYPNDHPVTTLGRIQQAVEWDQVTPEEQDALYRALGLK